MAAINPVISVPAVANRRPAEVASSTRVDVAAEQVGADAPNYVSIYAGSIAVVTLLFLIGVGLPAAIVYGTATGLGLGGTCAFWGGPSFGVMVASARVSTWFDEHGEH